MSAILNSTTSPLPLSCDKPETEAEEEAFPPANYYVCSAKVLGTGIFTEYAIARAEIRSHSIHLNFTVNEKPPKDMIDFLNSSEFTPLPKAVEEFSNKKRSHSVWGMAWSDGTNKVTEIFLKLYFDHPPELSSILGPIGKSCKSIFPNMIPKKSTVDVYYGPSHWRADRIFRDQALMLPAASILVPWK